MNENVGAPQSPMPDPIPTEPSAESVRLLHRRERGNRAGMEKFAPGGMKLAMFRGMIRFIAATGRLPRGVRSEKTRYGQHRPATWIIAQNAERANGALLFLHGGGFVLPSAHSRGAAKFSELTGLPVFLPEYRLAPEHPFPAAADDALAAYTSLLDSGIPASGIRIAGDSSGGFLTAALLGDIERAGLPMPAAVLLLSPLVDLSVAPARRQDAISRDPATAPNFIEATNHAYLADTLLTDRRLDVLGADKRTWPPVLIQTGGTECVTAENEQLAESIRAGGGTCELQIWPGQIHVFPILGGDKIPEAGAAREYAGGFLVSPHSSDGTGATS